MGYYSLLETMHNDARTEKGRETIKNIIDNATGLYKEGIGVAFIDEEEIDVCDYGLVITIDKNGNIDLECQDSYAKWDTTEELATLLSMIIDHGHINIKFTGEDGTLCAYKIGKNKVYYSSEVVFRYKKMIKRLYQDCIRSMKNYNEINEPLYLVNLTKKQLIQDFTINDFGIGKKGTSILTHLLETVWNGNRVIVLGKFYKDNFNKMTDTYYQRIIKEYEKIPTPPIQPQKDRYKNKYFVNYTKKIEIDITKEITVNLLQDSTQQFFPFARIFALSSVEGEWVKNKVGIITK